MAQLYETWPAMGCGRVRPAFADNSTSVITLDRVCRALRQPLPGLPAQLRMAPPNRPHDFRRDLPPPRRAGVLLLLYPRPRELFFVLMRRTERAGVHSGQISFPGGRWEPGDADLTATALRETHEELGVSLDRVQVLGPLTELYIPPSHFLVYPTVAYIDHAPEFHPQPSEVAEVVEAPIEILSDPAVRGESPRPLASQGGKITATPHFRIGGHLVWGATAMILCEFEAAVAQA